MHKTKGGIIIDTVRALDAQKKIEEAQYEVATIEGKVEEVKKQLKELANVDSIGEAKVIIATLTREIEKEEKEIEEQELWLEENCEWF